MLCSLASSLTAKTTVDPARLIEGGTWVVPFNYITQEMRHFDRVSFRRLDTTWNFLLVEGDTLLTLQTVTSTGELANRERWTRRGPLPVRRIDGRNRNGLGGLTWRVAILSIEKKPTKKGGFDITIQTKLFFKEPIHVYVDKSGDVVNVTVPRYYSMTGELCPYDPEEYYIGKPLP